MKTYWNKGYKNNIVRFGGVGYNFSKAFDYPDYTASVDDLGTKWENENVTIDPRIYNSNPVRGGKVNVTLNMENPMGDIEIDGVRHTEAKIAVTKSVNMLERDLVDKKHPDHDGNTISWQVNVGTYPQHEDARVRKYWIEIAADEELVTDNNSSDVKTVTLKRDFEITSLSLDTNDVFENDAITATFVVTNNNPHKDYTDVPVKVSLYEKGWQTMPVQTGTISNLPKYSKDLSTSKTCTLRFNVGSVHSNADQDDLVIAVVNEGGVAYKEGVDTVDQVNHALDNNRAQAGVKVRRIIDLAVRIVDPGVTYSDKAAGMEGTQGTHAVVSCLVYNMSRFNLYEANTQTDDAIQVTLTTSDGETIGTKFVDVPANNSNLVWFRWNNVPTTAKNVQLQATLSWQYEEYDQNSAADNTDTFMATVRQVDRHKTPETKLELTKTSNYSTSDAYKQKKPYVAQWSQYVWTGSPKDGKFVLHMYAVSTKPTAKLTPMTAQTGADGKTTYVYADAAGKTIASGSGFSLSFHYDIEGEHRAGIAPKEKFEPDYAKDGEVTFVQNVEATFPEFNYSRNPETGKFRTLYFKKGIEDRSLWFEESGTADGKARLHFTPVNMPNGQYTVGIIGYDLWTPAGMLYVNASPALMINGSIYNDNYVS